MLQELCGIGDETYDSLQDAIDVCAVNQSDATTIKVLKSFISTLTDIATIQEEKNIILDLNGYEISNYGDMINNNGKLQIIDTSVSKTGIIKGYSKNLIKNNGDLNINVNITQYRTDKLITNEEQGNVEISGGNIRFENDYEYISKGYGIYNTGSGTIKITGGNITSNTSIGKTTNVIYSNNSNNLEIANIIITGGNIVIEGEYQSYGIYVEKNTNVNMKDGLINSCNGIFNNKSSVIMEGGTIIAKKSGVYNNYGNVNIIGGDIQTNSRRGFTRDAGILNAYGTLEIENVHIVADNCSGIFNNGTTTIKNLNIDSKGTGIYTNSGTVDLLSGEINISGENSEQYGIYVSGPSIINLGVKDYPVSVSLPSITSPKYGIYCNGNNAKLNFYDGVIDTQGKAIYGNIQDTPELYTVQFSNGDKCATLTINATFSQVAIMNGVHYDSLQEAVKVAGNRKSTITLTKDNVLEEKMVIQEGQDITIDLYGNSIILPYGDYTIENNGTLTIIDSLPHVEGDEVVVSVVENRSGKAINNKGTLTIGIDDGNVNPNSPVIKGAIGSVTVYDGVIE